MTQTLEIGNSVQPLTNVATMAELVVDLKDREFGDPGLGVFYGYPGYGKTFGAIFCASKFDVIHLSMQGDWTKSYFLEQLLGELGISPQRKVPQMVSQACEGLAHEGRLLIVDEADYAFKKGMIELIRDIHDGSDTPILLIGMEEFPHKLKKYDLIDSRVLRRVPALPATFKDARLIADSYSREITIEDDMVEFILERNTGNVRRMVADIRQVRKEAAKLGLKSMSRQDWGGTDFQRKDAPRPRAGLLK
ncbi:ATP-binding protein [Leisingera sp. NJS201]|uniref:AAA family ATPase n=1 Tax=Leisingera sp. NJS201 TaxID=2508306 RepID=UPI0010713D1B|nr:ATP-binding protein [Leisingera sp. NJS201]QBR36056.1 ATP-binding protein [Leisingera sp. NJS201]